MGTLYRHFQSLQDNNICWFEVFCRTFYEIVKLGTAEKKCGNGKLRIFRGRAYSKYVLTFLFFSLSMGISNAAPDPDAIVAVGKGIVIKKGDVNNFRRYMEKKKFRTSDEQFLKVLIRMTLFATEAEKFGLCEDCPVGIGDNAKIERLIRLSNLYIAKLQSEYQVSDLIIESYYLSNPEKFDSKDGGDQSLNDEQKETIRKIVRNAKRPEIAKKAFEDLSDKYQIERIQVHK